MPNILENSIERTLGNGKNRLAHMHSAKATFSNGAPPIAGRKQTPVLNGSMIYEINYDTVRDLDLDIED